jgi:hypothetical protein
MMQLVMILLLKHEIEWQPIDGVWGTEIQNHEEMKLHA